MLTHVIIITITTTSSTLFSSLHTHARTHARTHTHTHTHAHTRTHTHARTHTHTLPPPSLLDPRSVHGATHPGGALRGHALQRRRLHGVCVSRWPRPESTLFPGPDLPAHSLALPLPGVKLLSAVHQPAIAAQLTGRVAVWLAVWVAAGECAGVKVHCTGPAAEDMEHAVW